MVTRYQGISLPRRGWECSECGEPYNSNEYPDPTVCIGCRQETIWQVPDDEQAAMRDTLRSAAPGDEVAFIPWDDHQMKGTVTEVDDEAEVITLDSDADALDERYLDIYALELKSDPEELYGDTLFHVVLNPDD